VKVEKERELGCNQSARTSTQISTTGQANGKGCATFTKYTFFFLFLWFYSTLKKIVGIKTTSYRRKTDSNGIDRRRGLEEEMQKSVFFFLFFCFLFLFLIFVILFCGVLFF